MLLLSHLRNYANKPLTTKFLWPTIFYLGKKVITYRNTEVDAHQASKAVGKGICNEQEKKPALLSWNSNVKFTRKDIETVVITILQMLKNSIEI